jgi:hypothetical protein
MSQRPTMPAAASRVISPAQGAARMIVRSVHPTDVARLDPAWGPMALAAVMMRMVIGLLRTVDRGQTADRPMARMRARWMDRPIVHIHDRALAGRSARTALPARMISAPATGRGRAVRRRRSPAGSGPRGRADQATGDCRRSC